MYFENFEDDVIFNIPFELETYEIETMDGHTYEIEAINDVEAIKIFNAIEDAKVLRIENNILAHKAL